MEAAEERRVMAAAVVECRACNFMKEQRRLKLMYRNIFIAVMLFSSLVAFNKSWADSYDATNFSADGRKYQPVPSCSTPGKDNGTGIGTHNPGEDCGICHRPLNSSVSPATPGKASKYLFTMSGTLYEDRAARKPLKNGEVIMQDINGKVICLKSNDVGNFWTYTAVGSNPRAIGGYGSVLKLYSTDASGNLVKPAPATDTRSWQYKAWVKNGDHVLPMVTIAPVGGGTDGTSRMSCNMHHAPMGTRGGLWASAKGTLTSYPASGLSYKKHILPIFMSKCAPCHIPGSTATRIVTKSDIDMPSTRIDYSKGLDLTSYNGSTVATTDGVTPVTKKGVSDAGIRSSILPKTDGTITHAGGKFWTAGNPDYEAIKKWLDEGGQNN